MKELKIENNERLFLLKLVNKEIQKAIQKNATLKKWELLYTLQDKFKGWTKEEIKEREIV